ncbi:MAG: fibronectin type III domain-containing protein, partial [Burkholderiaceae bacterium]|nr:fibronectin type III domain-containing protein [Burkholderiaceae bacterium]
PPADKAIIDAGAFTDTVLTPNTAYRYRIRATNSAPSPLTSSNSAVALAYTQAVYIAPIGFSATPGDARVTLGWTVPTQVGQPIQGYTVMRSLDGSSYYYRVAALTSLGVGAFSSIVSTTPVGSSQAPGNLYAITGDTSVLLTWTSPLNSGGSPVTGYRIIGCDTPSRTGSGATITGCTTTVYTPNTNTTTTSYNVTGLT